MLGGKDAGARGTRKGTDAHGVGELVRKSECRSTDRGAASDQSQTLRAPANRIVVKQGSIGDEAGLVEVVHPPVQKAGYIEQVITTYEKLDGPRLGAREGETRGKKGA